MRFDRGWEEPTPTLTLAAGLAPSPLLRHDRLDPRRIRSATVIASARWFRHQDGESSPPKRAGHIVLAQCGADGVRHSPDHLVPTRCPCRLLTSRSRSKSARTTLRGRPNRRARSTSACRQQVPVLHIAKLGLRVGASLLFQARTSNDR